MIGNYLNKNGLVEGNIPKGGVCQFYDKCWAKVPAMCPHESNTRTREFSCALARLFSMQECRHHDDQKEDSSTQKGDTTH